MKWLVVVLLVAVMVQAGSAFITTVTGSPDIGYEPLKVEFSGWCYGDCGGGCGYTYNWSYNTSNQIQWSDDFVNWSKSNCVVTADNTTAPDGSMTAERIQTNGTTAGYITYVPAKNVPNNTYHTFSIFVKAGSFNSAAIIYPYNPFTASAAYAIVSGPGDMVYHVMRGYYVNNLSSTEWTRISGATTTIGAYGGTNMNVSVYPQYFQSTSSGYIYVWGSQFELGATASEYWPTNGTVVQPERVNFSTQRFPNYTFAKPGRYTVRLNETGWPPDQNMSMPYFIDVINSSTCNSTGSSGSSSCPSASGGSIARPPPTPVDVPIIIAGVVVGIFIARNRFKGV